MNASLTAGLFSPLPGTPSFGNNAVHNSIGSTNACADDLDKLFAKVSLKVAACANNENEILAIGRATVR